MDPSTCTAISLGVIAICQCIQLLMRVAQEKRALVAMCDDVVTSDADRHGVVRASVVTGSGTHTDGVTFEPVRAAADMLFVESSKSASSNMRVVTSREFRLRIHDLDKHLQSFHPMSDWTSAQFVDYVARVRDEVRFLAHVAAQQENQS